ncbi:MAG: FCD domain-containing protein [Alphaproteobacteria bacterium]|nr:FCD domain-containing protein [Alphaproteobacteria bacterium]
MFRWQPALCIGLSQRAAIEHKRIVSALEDRDAELAVLHMRRHIAATQLRKETAIAAQSKNHLSCSDQ